MHHVRVFDSLVLQEPQKLFKKFKQKVDKVLRPGSYSLEQV